MAEKPRAKARHAGRPPRPVAKTGEKVTVSIRSSAELKEKLIKAADERGVPFSQEAELRLELSFREQALLPQLLGLAYGPSIAALLTVMGKAMKATAEYVAFDEHGTMDAITDWYLDPAVFNQVVEAANRVLEATRPPGDTTLKQRAPAIPGAPDEFMASFAQRYAEPGRARADDVLRRVAGEVVILDDDWVETARQQSSKLVSQIEKTVKGRK